MPSGDLLSREMAMRHRSFVGREAELGFLREVFESPGPQVVHVHGPAGVGKSALLGELIEAMRAEGVGVAYLDARDIAPSRGALGQAFDAAGIGEGSGRAPGRTLVVLDTYELLDPLEPALVRDLLRRVDDETVLVLGSRRPPSAEWRGLASWGRSVRALALRNLSSEASERYLGRCGVDAAAIPAIAAFAHGHPLALAIAADAFRQAPSPDFDAEHDLGVITGLYDYFVRGIREPDLRAVLELAAILPAVSEGTLEELLGPSKLDRFAWLRGLGFVAVGPRGLYPHDLAREVILAELRWRNTERLATLVLRALRHCADLVEAASPEDFTALFGDFAFVLGHNPRARVLMVSEEKGLTLGELRAADVAAIEAAVARHEGEAEVEHLRLWLDRQPASFTVARRADESVAAFIACVRLDQASPEDRRADPLAEAAWIHATEVMGGDPKTPIVYTRYFMSCEHHQAADPAMGLCSQVVGPLFFTPGFSFLLTRMSAWDDWGDTARLCGAEIIPSLAHRTGGKDFLVTVQDHRGLSGVKWLARFCERTSLADWRLVEPRAVVDSSLSALSRDEFKGRVREALRALADPLVLARNPLVHGRLIRERVDARATLDERAAALAELLREQIDALGGSARGDSWRRVMAAAYVEPGAKHEVAARELAMSYSTFRRHLGAATEHIADALWEAEVG